MTTQSLNVLRIAVCLAVSLFYASAELEKISVKGNFFVDTSGRTRLFHGFCDAGEETNRIGRFDGTNYLPVNLMQDAANLDRLVNEFGFNAFRIGAMWAALQPEENTTDTVYLAALKNATETLGQVGAYALLDMHQDGLSPRVQSYDGMPLWLANRTKIKHPYPWPFKHAAKTDVTAATGQLFEELYKNTHGQRDVWASAWKTFAGAFKSVSSVLGYELLNEPFAGDPWANPLLWDPAYAGSHNLQPAYEVVSRAIREEDAETVIFFEPVVWGMIWSNKLLGSGFDRVPGGPAYANRSAFSFHYYCRLLAEQNRSEPYPRMKKEECEKVLGPKVFKSVHETIAKIGGASMMTEWGGTYFTPNKDPNGTSSIEGEWVMAEADRQFQSWTHWDLPAFGHHNPALNAEANCKSSQWHCLLDFVRPYAQAIAGEPISMQFDAAKNNSFVLIFKPDSAVKAPTEIFVPPYRYPQGYHVNLEPAAGFNTTVCPGQANKLCVGMGEGAKVPHTLAVSITPK